MQNNKMTVNMTVEQINQNFIEFKVTPEDFKAPTKEFVFNFFSYFFEEFGIEIGRLLQPSASQLKYDTHAGLVQDTLQYANISRFINGFFQKIAHSQTGSEPFTLSDLINPTSSRTLVFLSIAMNFFWFVDSCIGKLQTHCSVIDERKKQFCSLLEECEQLKTELSHRALCIAKGLDFTEQAKVKKKQFNELDEEVKSLTLLSESRQSELEETRKRISHIEDSAVKLREKIKELELQLVSSPDTLKSEHLHLEQKLTETEQKLKDAEANLAAKKSFIKHLEEMDTCEDSKQAILLQIIDSAKKVKEQEKKLNATTKANMDALSNLTDREAEKSKLNVKLSTCNEQTMNLQLQWEKKKTSLQENLRHQKQEMSNLETKESEKIKILLQELEEGKNIQKEHIASHKKLSDYYEKMYAKLMEKEKMFIKKKEAEHESRCQDMKEP